MHSVEGSLTLEILGWRSAVLCQTESDLRAAGPAIELCCRKSWIDLPFGAVVERCVGLAAAGTVISGYVIEGEWIVG